MTDARRARPRRQAKRADVTQLREQESKAMLHAMKYRRKMIKSQSFDAGAEAGRAGDQHQRRARGVLKSSSFQHVHSSKAAKPLASPALNSSSSLLRIPSVKEQGNGSKQALQQSSSSSSFPSPSAKGGRKKKAGKAWSFLGAFFRTAA